MRESSAQKLYEESSLVQPQYESRVGKKPADAIINATYDPWRGALWSDPL